MRFKLNPGFRNCKGTNLPEFVVALFALVFCGLIPLCNLMGFGSSYICLSQLTVDIARRAGMADSRVQAEKTFKSIEDEVKHPWRCALHTIHAKKIDVTVSVINEHGQRSEYKAFEPLPAQVRPSRGKSQALYFYRLSLCSEIMPLFNLSGIPVIGQVPIIGGPTVINSTTEVPIEYPCSLDQ